jgi:hypothetical protein
VKKPFGIVRDGVGQFALDTQPAPIDRTVRITLDLLHSLVFNRDQDPTTAVASSAATPNEVSGHFLIPPRKGSFGFPELPFTPFNPSKTDIIVIYWVMPVKKMVLQDL